MAMYTGSFKIADLAMNMDFYMNHELEVRYISNIGSRNPILKSERRARNSLRSGIREFSDKNSPAALQQSIEYTTQCLALAPLDTDLIPLAYANRSAVLLKAGMYEEALIDIERAFNSNYPDNLKAKLFLRRSLCYRALSPDSDTEANKALVEARECFQKMDENDPDYPKIGEMLAYYPEIVKSLGKPFKKLSCEAHIPKMSDENPEIIGASGAIKIEYTKDRGQFIVAARNIEPGEFFFVGEPYAAALVSDRRLSNCWHCLKQTWTGIPCQHCSEVIYCSMECKVNSWMEYHEYECKILFAAVELDLELSDILALRILLKTVKNAGGFDNLKKQIQAFEEEDDDPRKRGFTGDVYDPVSDASMNSIDTVKGALFQTVRLSEGLRLHLIRVITMLAGNSDFFGKELTPDEVIGHKHTALAAVLFWKYSRISDLNILHVSKNKDLCDAGLLKQRDASVMPIYTLFSKGCWSNISGVSFGNKTGFFADLPIKKGEELAICSVFRYTIESFKKRERISTMRFGKPCKCRACVRSWPLFADVGSYQDRRLREDIHIELSEAVSQSKSFWKIVDSGSVEECKEIFETVSNMIKSFDKYVAQPCQELTSLSFLMSMLCSRLGSYYCQLTKYNGGVRGPFEPYFDDDKSDQPIN